MIRFFPATKILRGKLMVPPAMGNILIRNSFCTKFSKNKIRDHSPELQLELNLKHGETPMRCVRPWGYPRTSSWSFLTPDAWKRRRPWNKNINWHHRSNSITFTHVWTQADTSLQTATKSKRWSSTPTSSQLARGPQPLTQNPTAWTNKPCFQITSSFLHIQLKPQPSSINCSNFSKPPQRTGDGNRYQTHARTPPAPDLA